MADLIERLYERHCQGDDLCGDAQREIERLDGLRDFNCKRVAELEALLEGKRQFITEFQKGIAKLEAELKSARRQLDNCALDTGKWADRCENQAKQLRKARERIAVYEREWRPRLEITRTALKVAETWPDTVFILDKALAAIPEPKK